LHAVALGYAAKVPFIFQNLKGHLYLTTPKILVISAAEKISVSRSSFRLTGHEAFETAVAVAGLAASKVAWPQNLFSPVTSIFELYGYTSASNA